MNTSGQPAAAELDDHRSIEMAGERREPQQVLDLLEAIALAGVLR